MHIYTRLESVCPCVAGAPQAKHCKNTENQGCIYNKASPPPRRPTSKVKGRTNIAAVNAKRSISSLLLTILPFVAFATTYALSFFTKYKNTLLSHVKVQTRRIWTKLYLEKHVTAFREGKLVTVWCGSWGNILGYIRYTNIYTQRIGDMTTYDVFCEGYPDTSVDDFLESKFAGKKPGQTAGIFHGLNRNSRVTVLCFVFFPLSN